MQWTVQQRRFARLLSDREMRIIERQYRGCLMSSSFRLSLATLGTGLLLVGTTVGCTHLAPPTPVIRVDSGMELRQAAELLDAQARKCWQRKASILRNGVLIDSRKTLQDTVRISAVRYGLHIGIQESFVIVEILPSSTGVFVGVSEGEYECDIGRGCYKMGLAKDVPRWLSGDLSCHPEPGTIPTPPDRPLNPDERRTSLPPRGLAAFC
jgi:hypothetical protein